MEKKVWKIDFVTLISNKDKNCEKKCCFLYIILSSVLQPKLINYYLLVFLTDHLTDHFLPMLVLRCNAQTAAFGHKIDYVAGV